MRALTPVEAAVMVAVLGSVFATALPAFVRNLHASKLVEPVDGLNRIATRATALAAGRPMANAYPDSVGPTPAEVPAGTTVTDPPGTWDNPTWRLLDFSWNVPHAFSFSFESRNTPDVSSFVARSHGDLDGDGSLSSFEISGSMRQIGEPSIGPLDMSREIE